MLVSAFQGCLDHALRPSLQSRSKSTTLTTEDGSTARTTFTYDAQNEYQQINNELG